MISLLLSLFKPRNVHYYRCELTYYRNKDNACFEICSNFFEYQYTEKKGYLALNDREIKRYFAPQLIKKMPRRLLCNGEVKVVSVQYMGAFKSLPPKKGGVA